MKKTILLLLSTVIFLTVPFVAWADLYTFDLIGTGNSSSDVGSQLQLVVTDYVDSTGVSFTFQNIGGIESYIADIYFDAYPDDDALNFSAFSFDPTGEVAFSEGADPGNLPGGGAFLLQVIGMLIRIHL